MKKFVLTLATSIAVSISFATDRLVQELGMSGAYSTISAAIAAANPGDRILVYPKTGGAEYMESPSLSLSGLQLLNAIEGERFKIQGTLNVGNGCTVLGAEANGSIVDVATSGTVHIVGCKVIGGQISASNTIAKTYVDNDSVITGRIRINNGRISGCYVSGLDMAFGCLELMVGAPARDDTTFIVGNKVESSSNSLNSVAIKCGSVSMFFYVSNNYIVMNTNTSGNGYGILIDNGKQHTQKSNVIINNTVSTSMLGGNCSFFMGGVSNTLMNVRNNLSTFSLGGAGNQEGFQEMVPQIQDITLAYNYVNGSTNPFYYLANGIGNFSTSNSQVDLLTGAILPGGDAINGGDPSPIMLDLDLTRNDAGCFGGSLSRANFTSSETGSRVLWMNAPRFLFGGQSGTISGEGVDK